MDLSRLSLPDWPLTVEFSQLPDSALAAAVSSFATLALLTWLAPRLSLSRMSKDLDASAPETSNIEFQINGTSIKAVTEPARMLLDGLAPAQSRLVALSDHLLDDCPDIRNDLETLVLYGTPFRHHCPRGDGTAFEVLGEPRGGAAYLAIRPASEDARALQDAHVELSRSSAEIRFLREVIDRAPVAAWSMGPDGQVSWANAAYRGRFDVSDTELPDHRIPDAFCHVLEEVPLTARGDGVRRRVSISGPQDAEAQWFELSQSAGQNGETLGFALEADDLVAAEASLRRFVETLTETFAHLPIGLAVFDKNRRLGLFNPALTDLVKIDAVWLAGRPSLRDFLERLRETRQMPEQKDFASWRRNLSELEEGARDGTYEQNWELPSGKIFRVTGRPHPQGALAFLFEDISTAIMLERKYRSELELSQATLDCMSEAVAVFDASGMLVFVNSAFEMLWSLDPMARLNGPGVAEMTRICSERCTPGPSWARLAEFATGAESRATWTDTVEMLDSRVLQLLVAPLPDASTLVVLRDLTSERIDLDAAKGNLNPQDVPRDHDAALEDLALDQIHLPVETAVQQLMTVIPNARSKGDFQILSSTAQGLKDGLARSRELHALAKLDTGTLKISGPLSGLEAALTGRGLSLDVTQETGAWDQNTRRVALLLGLTAAEIATPNSAIAISFENRDGLQRLRVRANPVAGKSEPESVSLMLARRLAEASSGTLQTEINDGQVVFVAELPAAGARLVPADQALPA